MPDWQRQWSLRACIPAVADVLCQPERWSSFLPHVPLVVSHPDGTLAITVSWHGLRLTSTCRAVATRDDATCTLLLDHRQGLLRGLREEWTANAMGSSNVDLSVTTTWSTPVSKLRRALAERIYMNGVIPASADQLQLLSESDWRSRAQTTSPGL